jgi:hypothetical protein
MADPADVDKYFRQYSSSGQASPKVWSDAWLLAVAESTGGQLITFDRALAKRATFVTVL